MGVDRLLIIKYNLLPMLAGLITAYRLYFGRAKGGAPPRQRADVQTGSPPARPSAWAFAHSNYADGGAAF